MIHYLNLKNHKIDISQDVFHENYFPCHSSFGNNNDPNNLSLPIP